MRLFCSVKFAGAILIGLLAAMPAEAAGCDQQAACFNVCNKYGSAGTPECSSACSPAVKACERERAANNEQSRRRDAERRQNQGSESRTTTSASGTRSKCPYVALTRDMTPGSEPANAKFRVRNGRGTILWQDAAGNTFCEEPDPDFKR